MIVKLKVNQHYIATSGAIKFGKAGEKIDVDPLFLKLIDEKYEIPAREQEKEIVDEAEIEEPAKKANKNKK